MISDRKVILCGQEFDVDMDESHLLAHKYPHSAVLSSQSIWVYGIIERISIKIFMQVVIELDGGTLKQIVEEGIIQ